MNVTSSVNRQSQTTAAKYQPKQDNYEKSIQNQITNLEEKINELDKDSKMSSEQKMKEKKSMQDEIQSLNNSLRQYQIEKRQKEAAETQEIAQKAAEANPNADLSETSNSGITKSETGVILSLSDVGKRLVVMNKVRTDLKGQLLTATTTEEKVMIQEKMDKLEKDMGNKFNESLEIIKEHQKDEKEKRVNKKSETPEEEIKTEEGEARNVESSGLENSGIEVEEDVKTQVMDEAKSES